MDKFHLTKGPSDPQLNPELADKMLANIFEACNIEPNEVPLEVLTAYSNYRKERYSLQRWIIIIALVAWILIPMLFISPKFNIAEKYADTGTPKYEVYVHTILPVIKVTASVEGKNISVYEMDPHNFSLQPTKNGPMDISVTLFNKQFHTETVMVDSYDDQNPTYVESDTSGVDLILTVKDEGTGIDFKNIMGYTEAGDEYPPLDYDEISGTITFPYPEEVVDIYVPDHIGNTLHLHITQ